MLELEVIERPEAATMVMDPVKRRILAHLSQPASAASLASRLGLSRQKVNYHLRALEKVDLVTPVSERIWGGLTERLVVASAAGYLVSPTALGQLAADPAHSKDRLSASYLLALAARAVREVGELWRRSRAENKRLATLSLDTCIRFANPADRAAFTRELSQSVSDLVSKYHDESSAQARPFRLLVASYPAPQLREENPHADSP